MLAPKSLVMLKEGGLLFHGRYVGSTGQVKVKAAIAQVLQQRARPVDQEAARPRSRRS